MSRVYHFYNRKHYGDNLLNLKFFYNLSPILKEKDIRIMYYYNAEYNKRIHELMRYVDGRTLSLRRLGQRPPEAVELFMGNKIGVLNHVRNFDKYYQEFYKRILAILELEPTTRSTSLYQPEHYLQPLYETLHPKYHNLDILILNSQPFSEQYNYNKEAMDAMCIFLHSKYKVATTTYVNDTIPCTFEDGLAIQDIGAISTHANYIVAVQSGPLVGCCNAQAKAHVKRWFILCDSGIRYSQIPVHNNCSIQDVVSYFETENTSQETT